MSEVVVPDPRQSTSGALPATVTGVAPSRPGQGAPKRRPSGAPPPLPHALHTTGAGWLIGAVVAVVAAGVIFRHGVRGAAIPITVVDDTRVR